MAGWRVILGIISLVLIGATPVRADSHLPILPMPQLNNESLYIQSWIESSKLDLRQDLEAAEKGQQRLVIIWEQKNCSDCKSMHEINLRIPRIVRKITENFSVIRMDIWGERNVIDIDGNILTESELAQKNKINFTPTVQFLAEAIKGPVKGGISGAEAFRFEGYFKPFHYYFLYHYVLNKGYESQPNFQRWLGDIGRSLHENNIKYDIWADALPAELPKQY